MAFGSKFYVAFGTKDGAQLGLGTHLNLGIRDVASGITSLADRIDGGVKHVLGAFTLLDHRFGIHQQHVGIAEVGIGDRATEEVVFQE